MVVLDDADPATVAEAIKIGGYWNSGQDCTASSRILVSERVYDDVLAETVKAVEALTVGDPAEGDEIEMGPVISQEQQERVLGFLERAVEAKATIVTGGGTVGDRGFFVKPTVVADVEQDAEIVQKRGLRAGRDGAALRLRRRGDRAGERRSLRARRLRLLRERRARAEGGGAARLRHRLGQRAPLPAGLGDAARRVQGVRLRQGHVALLDGGVHAHQARRGEARPDERRLRAVRDRGTEARARARPRRDRLRRLAGNRAQRDVAGLLAGRRHRADRRARGRRRAGSPAGLLRADAPDRLGLLLPQQGRPGLRHHVLLGDEGTRALVGLAGRLGDHHDRGARDRGARRRRRALRPPHIRPRQPRRRQGGDHDRRRRPDRPDDRDLRPRHRALRAGAERR